MNFEKLLSKQVFINHNCNPFQSSSNLSIRFSFGGCVIYTSFSWFEQLFSCPTQFDSICHCLNFDIFRDTAPLTCLLQRWSKVYAVKYKALFYESIEHYTYNTWIWSTDWRHLPPPWKTSNVQGRIESTEWSSHLDLNYTLLAVFLSTFQSQGQVWNEPIRYRRKHLLSVGAPKSAGKYMRPRYDGIWFSSDWSI